MIERRPRRLLGSLLVPVVLLVPAGCERASEQRPAGSAVTASTVAAGPKDTDQQTIAELERLLAARAAALVRKDRVAFLAVVDPRRPRYRERQERIFGNLEAVPLDSFEHEVTTARDHSDQPLRRRYRPDPVLVPEVEVRYRLRGEATATIGRSYMTFVRTPTGWRIGGENEAPASPEPGYHLWNGSRLDAVASERTLVVFGHRSQALARRVLRVAERSYAAVGEVWRSPWERRAVLLMPSRKDPVEQFTGGLDLAEVPAAVPNKTTSDTSNNRMFVNERIVRTWDDADLDYLLAHEMTHIATRRIGGRVPMFLGEGLAEYVASNRLGLPFRDTWPSLADNADRFDGKLPGRSGLDADDAYDKAGSFCAWVAETFGRSKLEALYRSFADANLDPPADEVDRRFEDTLGLSYPAAERRWASWVRARL